MYRQIITPRSTQFLLQLPAEYIGKMVEVIAFTVKEEKKEKKHSLSKTKNKEIEDFYHSINVKVRKGFKFNREESHER